MGLERVLRSTALRVLLGAISAGLLVLVFATALVGEPSSAVNLAPTFIYVVFWLGLVPVQVLLGNVWPALNPWLAFANAISWVSERLGWRWTPPLSYPERLGVWPGAVLLFCFAALELAYAEPGSPRALALAVALYSYVTWFGMAAFGRRDMGRARRGVHGLLRPAGTDRAVRGAGRTAGRPDAALRPRRRRDDRPGLLAFVAVMLGSVGFDGLSRSPFWQNLRADVEGPYILDSPGTAELVSTALALAGLLGCVLLVALAYRAATRCGAAIVETDRPFEQEFVRSLVPIALVYAVAHYFTCFSSRASTDPARVRPVRLRLGSLRHGRLTRRTSRRSRRTRSGTSRSARSSPATSPGSRSRTTAR